MKALLRVLCAIFAVGMLMLTACSSQGTEKPKEELDVTGSKYIGTWICKEGSFGDDKSELKNDITMVLNEDATGELTSDDEVTKFTWEESKKGIQTYSKDFNVELEKDGDNKLKMTFMGVEMVFEKQE